MTLKGIDPHLLNKLKEVLLICAPIHSDNSLRTIFVDSRISQWHATIPEASSPQDRVEKLVHFLIQEKDSSDNNGLVLFLSCLSERINQDNKCSYELERLSSDLIAITNKFENSTVLQAETASDTMRIAGSIGGAITTAVTGAFSGAAFSNQSLVIGFGLTGFIIGGIWGWKEGINAWLRFLLGFNGVVYIAGLTGGLVGAGIGALVGDIDVGIGCIIGGLGGLFIGRVLAFVVNQVLSLWWPNSIIIISNQILFSPLLGCLVGVAVAYAIVTASPDGVPPYSHWIGNSLLGIAGGMFIGTAIMFLFLEILRGIQNAGKIN